MADEMYVTITLRKKVPDREAGRTIYDLIKERMNDRPDVDVKGLVSNHFNLDE